MDKEPVIPKKRGRRKKSEMLNETKEPTVPKKRGRKPKGGKLTTKITNSLSQEMLPRNVILHLDCNLVDLEAPSSSIEENLRYKPSLPPEVKAYDTIGTDGYGEYENKNKHDNFAYSDTNDIVVESTCKMCSAIKDASHQEDDNVNMKDINAKLKQLKISLYNNDLQGKTSSCFWCTYEFDNHACYIPKSETEENVCGYGSFCRPECAVAHLFKENIDDSTKFERYQLLNQIYSKVYEYKENIKPAPDPHYLLDKFFGVLSIQEYRKLLTTDNLLFVIDKPMTRILPELFEDNDNFVMGIYGNSVAKSQSSTSQYKVKRQSEKQPGPSKSSIMRDKFGMVASN